MQASSTPESPREVGSSPSASDEARIDSRRYITALRRSAGLIATIAGAVVALVLFVSLTVPEQYETEATILFNVEDPVFGTINAEDVQRQLSTLDALVSSAKVRESAADALDLADPDDLDGAFSSDVDPEANLIFVAADDEDPELAAAVANAVAQAFIREETQRNTAALREGLELVDEELSKPDLDPLLQQRLTEQKAALEAEIRRGATSLELVERAEVPTSPSSPKPARNAILGLFAALFVGILIALARDQLNPGISEPREISRMTGLPILAGLPYVGGRFSRKRSAMEAVEHETYQSLAAGLRLIAPPAEHRVILISSAVHSEGKTTVTARLGRLLAQSGHSTLMISADLRWPRLHELFDVPVSPGLTDALGLVRRAGVNDQLLPATLNEVMVQGGGGGRSAELHLLTSGGKPQNAAALLGSDASAEFFDHVRSFGYDYVLVDGPPVLGIADVQGLARLSDDLILVSRLDRITRENIVDLQELLGRIPISVLGHVVVGARVEVSPYYLNERPVPEAQSRTQRRGDPYSS